MRLYILRHGQTNLNVERKVQGHINSELNETGIRQAEELAEVVRRNNLHFDTIFCSPLKRAMDTCQIVTGLDPSHFIIDERIKEFDFGEIEGTPYRDLPGESKTFFTAPDKYQPQGRGETFQHLIARTSEFLKELKTRCTGNVLLTSHGTAIHAMLLYFRGKELKDFWDEDVHNCDLMIVDLVDGEYVVREEKVEVAKIDRSPLEGIETAASTGGL